MTKENANFWKTVREQTPNGRFEFYDERTNAKGTAVVINGNIVSVHIREAPAGWSMNHSGQITHWREEAVLKPFQK